MGPSASSQVRSCWQSLLLCSKESLGDVWVAHRLMCRKLLSAFCSLCVGCLLGLPLSERMLGMQRVKAFCVAPEAGLRLSWPGSHQGYRLSAYSRLSEVLTPGIVSMSCVPNKLHVASWYSHGPQGGCRTMSLGSTVCTIRLHGASMP